MVATMSAMSHSHRLGVVTTLTAVAALGAAVTLSPPATADDVDAPAVPGEFVVELKPEADPDVVNVAVGGVGNPQHLSPTSTLWLFRLDPMTDPVEGTKLIENTNHVVDAQPNHLAEIPEFFGGRVRYWTDLEPPDTTAQATAATVDQPALGSAGLPATGANGAGVVVAILDTGLDTTHPEFTDRVTADGHDFVDNDTTPAEERNGHDDNANDLVDEAYGHGTYVAGIVGLIAADVEILPIRILDTDGTTTAWRILQGLDRSVGAGADIINMSLGGRYLGDIVDRSVEQLEKLGIAVVAAAGNSATSEQRYPAASNGVVAATAIDGRTGKVATFSNTGSWIDVAAPGVRIVSAYPEHRYATWGGTSAAAPVVAATLALLRETMPHADVDDVIDKLTSTAHADELPNVSSYGRIDISAAIARATTG
jgi:subtilisin family serine protease